MKPDKSIEVISKTIMAVVRAKTDIDSTKLRMIEEQLSTHGRNEREKGLDEINGWVELNWNHDPGSHPHCNCFDYKRAGLLNLTTNKQKAD